jgi:kinesin family protein 3/17
MASRSETVQVMVRCRPLNSKEKSDNRKEIVDMDSNTRQVTLRNPKSDGPDDAKQFTFDQVFDQASRQDQVFNLVAQPIIDSVMSGYNGTIFAYGQTGTGKTHTMEGKPGPATQGIIPNAFDYIFSWINDTSHVRCLVRASFLEIYNEEVRDLLSPEAKNHDAARGLELKETADKGVYVKDLQVVIVDSVPAIKKLLDVRTH